MPDSHFGPQAQTPAQRAQVLRQMQQTLPGLTRHATPYVHQLYSRYIAGELSWLEVCAQRDAPPTAPG